MKKRPGELSVEELALLGSEAAKSAAAKAEALGVELSGLEPEIWGHVNPTREARDHRAPPVVRKAAS